MALVSDSADSTPRKYIGFSSRIKTFRSLSDKLHHGWKNKLGCRTQLTPLGSAQRIAEPLSHLSEASSPFQDVLPRAPGITTLSKTNSPIILKLSISSWGDSPATGKSIMKPDVCTSRKRETSMVKKINGLAVPMIRIKELAKGMALLEDQFQKGAGDTTQPSPTLGAPQNRTRQNLLMTQRFFRT